MKDYHGMWKDLGLDLERHDEFLSLLAPYFEMVFGGSSRPNRMDYFYGVTLGVHGSRIEEILDARRFGKKVVGGFCAYVPEEVIMALDGIFVGVCGGSQFPIPDAEEVLPRNLCPLVKSAFGFMKGRLCPYYSALDLLVGETTCDGKKKVWEVFSRYVPMYVMEVPNRRGVMGKKMWEYEVKRFSKEVEELSGRKLSEERLEDSIKLMNRKRRAMRRLFELRKKGSPLISGRDALLISQIAYYDDPLRFTENLELLCDELEAVDGSFFRDMPRVMISGCPFALPFWKVHSIVEESGAVVVCEESCVGTRYFWDLCEEDVPGLDGKLRAISERYLKINCSCFTPNEERFEDIKRFSEEFSVDGVILFNLQFCLTYSVENSSLKRDLEALGIPALEIETDYGEEDEGQLKTRIEAFLERISQ